MPRRDWQKVLRLNPLQSRSPLRAKLAPRQLAQGRQAPQLHLVPLADWVMVSVAVGTAVRVAVCVGVGVGLAVGEPVPVLVE